VPPDSATGVPIEAILLLPPDSFDAKDGAAFCAKKKPSKCQLGLVVVPHGGPHSCTPTSWVGSYAYLARETGCAVLHVNYRGSIGFGAPDLNSLPGKVGDQDVRDMVFATELALELESSDAPEGAEGKAAGGKKLLDRDRVAVVGGSHGGFLGGHLVGQRPDLFKCAALRNPVTNLPAMCSVSDIPDWCTVEALGLGHYDFKGFSPCPPEALPHMFAKSPVAHIDKVCAPTLLALGEKDRRVPCSQGVEYYHLLKARGVPARLLMYPEDSHPIDKPASEADQWVNIAAWINQHLK